ncbi:HD domain-containing protein [Konateibacter massiliensis]|uniref:HD domain-containing protein n=1 Tax=Konateibacter massiliensis TaxID=2002841 RepID=UPI000C147875|nr:HD domain-containing protein [Konateibacter massiliensis]
MEKRNRLIDEMIAYYEGDPKRIQHFMKVYGFASVIGEMEELDAETLEILKIAAIVHDIGIRYCEREFGACNGKLQEQYGPPIAKEMLNRLGFEEKLTERVCYLISRHHTYTDIDGMDYQILVEADFLVNLYEDEIGKAGVESAYNKIFRTETGKRLCRNMFAQ